MFCIYCGTKSLDGSVFCQSCGAKQAVPKKQHKKPLVHEQSVVLSTNKDSKKVNLVISVSAVIILAAATGIILMLTRNDAEQPLNASELLYIVEQHQLEPTELEQVSELEPESEQPNNSEMYLAFYDFVINNSEFETEHLDGTIVSLSSGYLLDFDNDGMPELALIYERSDLHLFIITVYQFKDNQVSLLFEELLTDGGNWGGRGVVEHDGNGAIVAWYRQAPLNDGDMTLAGYSHNIYLYHDGGLRLSLGYYLNNYVLGENVGEWWEWEFEVDHRVWEIFRDGELVDTGTALPEGDIPQIEAVRAEMDALFGTGWIPLSVEELLLLLRDNMPVSVDIDSTIEPPPNGYITIREVQFCTSLEMLDLGWDNEWGISGLTDSEIVPLQHMTNLIELRLTHGSISDLAPLSGLTNLRWLTLNTNQISDIAPLSGLTNLESLDLHNNAFYTPEVMDLMPLSELTSLTSLTLGSNSIRSITPLSGLTNLRWLHLNNNDISDIAPLSRLTNLESLELGMNHFGDITPLSGLTNLTNLSLSSNGIWDLAPLSGLTNLRRLYLNGNSIGNLTPLSGLTNLERLDLGFNRFEDITALAGLTNLTNLNLSMNGIIDVSPLAGLISLSSLSLSDNRISDITPLASLSPDTMLRLGGWNSIADWSPVSHITDVQGRP